MTPHFVTGSAAFAGWRAAVEANTPPVTFPVAPPGHPLAAVEVGPGVVLLVGAPPGAGKTTLANQLAFDALALDPARRVLLCNVEMSVPALLDRQLARLAGLPYRLVRRRELGDEHRDRLAQGLDRLAEIVDRVAFLAPRST
jgi:replicative DNA helicase